MKCAVTACPNDAFSDSRFCRAHIIGVVPTAAPAATPPAVAARRKPPLPPSVFAARLKFGLVAFGVIAIIIAAVVTASRNHSGSPGNFATKESQNGQATASDSVGLLAETYAATATSDLSGLVQIGSDADTLHTHLDDYRQQLLGDVDTSNSSQMDLLNAENDLKKSVGAISTWAADPSSGNASSMISQLTAAIPEWNGAVDEIWPGDARYTISLPSN